MLLLKIDVENSIIFLNQAIFFFFYNIKAPPVFSDLYQSTASIATREN
jgi:hypothetical protein